MPQLTCIDPNEQAIEVAFEPGETILQATYRAGVDGILAECGGGCSCATCHVMLTSDWDGTLDAPSPQEADMLSFAVDPTPQSRLACQVQLNEQHDGLTLTVAKRQY
ncbi:MAG: 2Fe-2S iron-sulfur cluster-binding protein [Litorivicinaceae bacterium]|jgi:2Fe-2S ferredoxin